MSFFGNVFDFEKFKLGNMWDKVQKNPEQLLLGAGDPLSAGVWSKITGKNYEPLVDQFGGATPDDYRKAEAAGIDTSDGRKMHGAARAIAGIFAGNAAAGAMGGAGAAGGAGAGASPGATAGASGGAAGAGSGWQTAGQFAGLANQSGLLDFRGQPMQTPQMQQAQSNPQAFSGLLSPTDQVDLKRRQQAQQMAVQGLLGGYRG